ncbi:MAG: hypothetical protein KBT36_11930 [Kurthia sp.]|nr:hypothetical protein [Candidatus Kurthia equi]
MDGLLRHLQYVEQAILSLYSKVDITTWKEHATADSCSIFKIFQHIATIPKADRMLAHSMSHQEIDTFYKIHDFQTVAEMTAYFSNEMKQVYEHMLH